MCVLVDIGFLWLGQFGFDTIFIEQEAVVSWIGVGDWGPFAKGAGHLNNVVVALARNDAA